MLRLAQHSAGPHVRLDRVRRERPFGEFADDQPLETRGVQEFLRLRIERGEIEGHENVDLAVLDLEFEPV